MTSRYMLHHLIYALEDFKALKRRNTITGIELERILNKVKFKNKGVLPPMCLKRRD